MNKVYQFIPVFLITVLFAGGTELHVDRSADNIVKFISDAKIETFEGVTSNVDGYLYWDGEDLTNKSLVYFEVDLNTLDTGIGLRNRHMRDNYLETNKYRFTNYKGKITEAKKNGDGIYDVKVEGTISIHGVIKPLTVDGTITMNDDKSYNIKTKFNVKLSDFKIDIPSLMFLKINEVIKVQLNINMKTPDNLG